MKTASCEVKILSRFMHILSKNPRLFQGKPNMARLQRNQRTVFEQYMFDSTRFVHAKSSRFPYNVNGAKMYVKR